MDWVFSPVNQGWFQTARISISIGLVTLERG